MSRQWGFSVGLKSVMTKFSLSRQGRLTWRRDTVFDVATGPGWLAVSRLNKRAHYMTSACATERAAHNDRAPVRAAAQQSAVCTRQTWSGALCYALFRVTVWNIVHGHYSWLTVQKKKKNPRNWGVTVPSNPKHRADHFHALTPMSCDASVHK